VINVTAVQQRFEDGISETKQQDVLDGFLSEVVIDAVDLSFQQVAVELGSQFDCGGEVSAEGFFNNNSQSSGGFAWRNHAGGVQSFHGGCEERGGGGKVHDASGIGGESGGGFQLLYRGVQGTVVVGRADVELLIEQLTGKGIPGGRIESPAKSSSHNLAAAPLETLHVTFRGGRCQ
jgi:hypothetical protein